MLTRKSKYGLKALLMLAEEAGRGPVPISELAERQRIPAKFLEAILLDLKRGGFLQSKKGKGGGYSLSRRASDITLALVPCVSQTAYVPCAECVDEATCRVRWAMKEVRDATATILDNMSLTGLNAKFARPSKARKR